MGGVEKHHGPLSVMIWKTSHPSYETFPHLVGSHDLDDSSHLDRNLAPSGMVALDGPSSHRDPEQATTLVGRSRAGGNFGLSGFATMEALVGDASPAGASTRGQAQSGFHDHHASRYHME